MIESIGLFFAHLFLIEFYKFVKNYIFNKYIKFIYSTLINIILINLAKVRLKLINLK